MLSSGRVVTGSLPLIGKTGIGAYGVFLRCAWHRCPRPWRGALVEDPALWEPVLGVPRGFLDAAFDQARQSFDSMDNFLRAGPGVDDATLDALRTKLAG
ncbi:tyrosine-protein phosphatase [Nocardia sp. NPDC003963]